MEQSTVTLVVGLAGIASTLIVSGMGLYYTARSRAAPLRQALFSKQLEMVVEIVHLQSRIRVFATLLSSKESPYLEEARRDIGEHYRQFAEAQEKAAVLLPVELWVEVKGLSDEMSDAIGEFDSQGIIEQRRMKTLIARMTKVALLSRVVTGSDELTEQSIDLFSSQKEYVRVANLEIAHFEEIHSRVNRKDA
ncbi:MAG: hypothetical protein OEU68_15955 [Nitrospira sp.]|nr:hypothetical protein [Nitrospira sp.]MDH4244888.1 hypothetical protein [Nitrospira sp.]MDH4355817.1 hypothetical protein [Nitrospira sp.]MDH5318050.1 hypothetical protein [Nitrospira sp.]